MKRLIVDGYNVLMRARAYAELARTDLDAARAALVSDVAAFAHGEFRATVVFDGGGNPASLGVPHDVAGVTVLFSPYGVDADAVIEQ
ncbi:MAG: NYN domain-containing protein, partial [Coriobacteriales bacterium]|nr:NYN domain-containing protein [Coriobacteriales bacterium]